MVGMLIYLGMRVSELVALSMSDIDLVGGILHIYRQKTDTESQWDMPAPLRQILRDYLKVRPEELGNGRLLAASRRVAVSVNPDGSELCQGHEQTSGTRPCAAPGPGHPGN